MPNRTPLLALRREAFMPLHATQTPKRPNSNAAKVCAPRCGNIPRSRSGSSALLLVFAMVQFSLGQGLAADPTPLRRAHAHNDYEHARPLLDALDHGFCSVEADIYLVDGQLLVAHDRDKVSSDRTLQKLYLDPLRQRVQQNKGRVFLNGPPFVLLIDIKSEAESTYRALDSVLRRYSDILTQYAPGRVQASAVMAIISGNRPRTILASQTDRFAALDGRLPDLESNPDPELVPLISDDWRRHFSWRGHGPIPAAERERIRELVSKAHTQKRIIRFWGAPDTPDVWQELNQAGVDLINTDNLPGLQQFLLKNFKH